MAYFSLTYIYHDCFLLETEEAAVIFDFWLDPLSKEYKNDSAHRDIKDFPPLLNELSPSKPLYVLVSHHHKDHFSRRIFLWQQLFPGVKYIISPDVFNSVKYMWKEGSTYKGFKPPINSVTVLSPYQSFSDGLVTVKAFPSTDIGNSYVVETGGLKVFHAGDLNAWLWLDESTEAEVDSARSNYLSILQEIRQDYPFFDISMFPVDSRLGREYWWGAKTFVDTILTGLFIPMHFELVLAEEDKIKRRVDAAAFDIFARRDYGAYLQLGSSRSRYVAFDSGSQPYL